MMELYLFSVRRAVIADIPGIQTVYSQCWARTYPNEVHGISEEDVQFWLKNRHSPKRYVELVQRIKSRERNVVLKVAERFGRIIGICVAVRGKRVNRLERLYVLPEFQGKGTGIALFYETYRLLNVARPTVVRAAVYNAQAIKFYKKLGFVDTGRRIKNKHMTMKSGSIIPEIEMILQPRPAT